MRSRTNRGCCQEKKKWKHWPKRKGRISQVSVCVCVSKYPKENTHRTNSSWTWQKRRIAVMNTLQRKSIKTKRQNKISQWNVKMTTGVKEPPETSVCSMDKEQRGLIRASKVRSLDVNLILLGEKKKCTPKVKQNLKFTWDFILRSLQRLFFVWLCNCDGRRKKSVTIKKLKL